MGSRFSRTTDSGGASAKRSAFEIKVTKTARAFLANVPYATAVQVGTHRVQRNGHVDAFMSGTKRAADHHVVIEYLVQSRPNGHWWFDSFHMYVEVPVTKDGDEPVTLRAIERVAKCLYGKYAGDGVKVIILALCKSTGRRHRVGKAYLLRGERMRLATTRPFAAPVSPPSMHRRAVKPRP